MFTDPYSLVRQKENNWIVGNIKISKYVFEYFYEDISRIEAYINSKHISGDKDSLGRDKPFFNIVLAARNVWFRATDLDRKNIISKATKAKNMMASYLFTGKVNEWMRDSNFGQFLNDWGLQLATYNAAVSEWVEKEEGLVGTIVPWNHLIVDILNFYQNPVIKILELTPDEMRSNPLYDQEMVEELILSAQQNRRLVDRQPKEFANSYYIKLYELHGKLPLSWLTNNDERDKNTFVQQMHVISYIGKGNQKVDGKFRQYNNYTLYRGREKENPFHLAQLIPNVDGSISLMGSVKSLFEAQWQTNHSIKTIKDYLDLATKIVYQTSDPTFSNQNMLENIETGQIVVWDKTIPNGNLTALNNGSHDIGALTNYIAQWKDLTQQVTNTPAVMTGNQSSSQSAYAKEALLANQAQANFDIMTQNKGLALEEIFRKFITPYILKKMSNSKEMVMDLNARGIEKIDKAYIINKGIDEYNNKLKEAVLNQDWNNLPDLKQEQAIIQAQLQNQDARYIKPSEIDDKTWKDIFKDFEADVQYQITNENSDKNQVFNNLNSILSLLMNPNALQAMQTPTGKAVWNKILEEMNIIAPDEPININQQAQVAQMAQPVPVQTNGQNV